MLDLIINHLISEGLELKVSRYSGNSCLIFVNGLTIDLEKDKIKLKNKTFESVTTIKKLNTYVLEQLTQAIQNF